MKSAGNELRAAVQYYRACASLDVSVPFYALVDHLGTDFLHRICVTFDACNRLSIARDALPSNQRAIDHLGSVAKLEVDFLLFYLLTVILIQAISSSSMESSSNLL